MHKGRVTNVQPRLLHKTPSEKDTDLSLDMSAMSQRLSLGTVFPHCLGTLLNLKPQNSSVARVNVSALYSLTLELCFC